MLGVPNDSCICQYMWIVGSPGGGRALALIRCYKLLSWLAQGSSGTTRFYVLIHEDSLWPGESKYMDLVHRTSYLLSLHILPFILFS